MRYYEYDDIILIKKDPLVYSSADYSYASRLPNNYDGGFCLVMHLEVFPLHHLQYQ